MEYKVVTSLAELSLFYTLHFIVILNFEILSQAQCLGSKIKRQSSKNTSATRYIGTRILRGLSVQIKKNYGKI